MSKKISYTQTLFDNEKNRKKHKVMDKCDVMVDDEGNVEDPDGAVIEDFLEWGKTYRITIEEIDPNGPTDPKLVITPRSTICPN